MKLKANYQKSTVLATTTPNPWRGTNIGAGATINTGDNPSQKGNTTLNLKYSTPPWIISTKIDQQYEHSADNGLSTDKYNVSSQANYLFGDSSFFYNRFSYGYDRFSGNDYIWNYSLGYGYTVYHSQSVMIDTQIGPGYQQRKIQGAATPESTVSVNTQAELNWQINDKTALTETITPIYTSNLTTINTVTALTTQLRDNLGLQAQFDTKYLSNTPEGSKRLATTTVFNVLYTFA
ncbi:DUF481 domain-containing protein [Piscirickettsia litoralis]|uniref:DUF481 domain-containing protein n=1 Tax=Piscirickettsia litoralis TaxID=1891921 RepID=UPI001F37CF17|nr:DUF481 domain-containing protein [Piscirickettsia litoralis]